MYDYGSIGNGILTRDMIIAILKNLPEVYWCKMKLNTTMIKLMKSIHRDMSVKELAKNGYIESLDNREVKFKWICESGDIDVVRRFSWGKNIDPLYGFKKPFKNMLNILAKTLNTTEKCIEEANFVDTMMEKNKEKNLI